MGMEEDALLPLLQWARNTNRGSGHERSSDSRGRQIYAGGLAIFQ